MKKIDFHDLSLNYLLSRSNTDLFNICLKNLVDESLFDEFVRLTCVGGIKKSDYIHLILLQLGLDNLGMQYVKRKK